MRRSQITIEFLIIVGISFFVILILLGTTLVMYRQNSDTKRYMDVDDMGKSFQEEFLLASQLEDGYTRKMNVPYTINDIIYTIQIGQTNPSHSYLVIQYDNAELFYLIPPVNGTILKGDNYIRKINNTLRIN